MEKIKRSALVHFSAQQMYQLVNNVAEYPHFVPYCKQAEIISQHGNTLEARVEVAKSGIAKSFSTRNQLTPFSQIEMTLIDGPFTELTGAWNFTPLSDDACKIELNLSYEFSHKLASLAFAKIFHQLTESMVSAFIDRANQIYG